MTGKPGINLETAIDKSSFSQMFFKKDVLKNVTVFTENTCAGSLKKRLPQRCFSVNIAKLLRMLFYRTPLMVTVFQYLAFYKSPNFRNCFIASVGYIRNNPAKVLLEKGVLKICSKFTAEHHVEVRFQ